MSQAICRSIEWITQLPLEVYVDDVIFGLTKDGNVDNKFKKVLSMLQATGLKLSPKKCIYGEVLGILGLTYDVSCFPLIKISCPDEKKSRIVADLDRFMNFIAGEVDLAPQSQAIIDTAQCVAGRPSFIIHGTAASRTLLSPIFPAATIDGGMSPDQLVALRRSLPILKREFVNLPPWTVDLRTLSVENIVLSDASLESLAVILVDVKHKVATLRVKPVTEEMKAHADKYSPKNPIMLFEAFAMQEAVKLATEYPPNTAAAVLVDNKAVLLSWCKGHSRNTALNDIMNQTRQIARSLPVITRYVPSRLNLADAWTRAKYADKANELKKIFLDRGFK